MCILTGTYIDLEALHQLMDKDAVEPVQISGLLQPTFLVPRFHIQGRAYQFQGPAIRFVHSTLGVHRDPKGGETDGHTQGFKNPPVPRRLVGESQIPPGLSPTYTGTSK